jgi:adenylyltransferase/sulfurtransferase
LSAGGPIAGRRPLGDASVAVVGVGALGCAAADVLADAGVGRLTLLDPDRVEPSNLHRQLLHRTRDVGQAKVESAAAKLRARRRATVVAPIAARVDGGNAAALLAGHDCVIDASDGITTKFLVNDAAVALGLPLVHAGVLRFLGQVMLIVPGRSACYRCLFGAPPDGADLPSCQEAGILGSVAATIGALQAAAAIHVLTGTAATFLADRLLTYDALTGRWRGVRLRRNPACRACGRAVEPTGTGIPPHLAAAPATR